MVTDEQIPATRGEDDAALVEHFQRMREEDSREAPVLPVAEVAAVRTRAWSRRLHGALLTGAVAASVLVVAGLLVTEREVPGDPATLYADTMSAFSLDTDQFLRVSESVVPGMLELPQVLDPGQPMVDDAFLN